MDANDEYGANLPLKDYGKRKPNDAVDTVQRQPAAKRVKYETSTVDQLNSTSSSENSTKNVQQDEESKNQKKKKKKKNHSQQTSGATNSYNQNSQQFDYGQVDFKKFKGGSQQAKRNDNEVHTKFHGKVRKNTFSIILVLQNQKKNFLFISRTNTTLTIRNSTNCLLSVACKTRDIKRNRFYMRRGRK